MSADKCTPFFRAKCSSVQNVKYALQMKRTACVKCALGTICGTLNSPIIDYHRLIWYNFIVHLSSRSISHWIITAQAAPVFYFENYFLFPVTFPRFELCINMGMSGLRPGLRILRTLNNQSERKCDQYGSKAVLRQAFKGRAASSAHISQFIREGSAVYVSGDSKPSEQP